MAVPTYSTGGPFSTGFAGYFPELATSDATAQAWITLALAEEWARLSSSFCGTDRAAAALLKVAIRYTSAYVKDKGRKVQSKSAGRQSVTFATADGQSNVYRDQLDDLADARSSSVRRLSR